MNVSPVLCIAVIAGVVSPQSDLCAATVVTASHVLDEMATGWTSVGAGMGTDGPRSPIFDNRLAQTFKATQTGILEELAFTISRPSTTTAPLRLDVTTVSDGQPGAVLASISLPAEQFGSFSGRPVFNTRVSLAYAGFQLDAGNTYALVFRSDTTEANYRLYGSNLVSTNNGPGYADGMMLKSQNSPSFREHASTDLFFEVTVKTVPEPASIAFLAGAGALLCGRRRRDR